MTTIAANLQEMSADSRLSSDQPLATVKKLHRIGGSIFGEAGGGFESLILLDWLAGTRNLRMLHKLPADFDRDCILVLELSERGLGLWNGWGIRQPLENDCFAIGSGAMSAMPILKQGGTTEAAIIAAAQSDECTGLPSFTMKLANIRTYHDERKPTRKRP